MVVSTQNRIRLSDIARKTGVSTVAVAKVLHGTGGKNTRVGKETALRVKEVAKRMNYTPNLVAQRLAGKQSRIIGVVIDSCAPQVSFNRLSEMERSAASFGYRFMIGQSHDDVGGILKYFDDFTARGVDGVICITHNYPGQENEIINRIGTFKNIVLIGKPETEGNNLPYVSVDIADGVIQAVDHILSIGKKCISLLIPHNQYRKIKERYRGYCLAMEKNNIPMDKNLVQVLDVEVATGISFEHVNSAVRKVVLGHNADAVLCSNDIVAAFALKSLRRLGLRVPEDVAVVGCDNLKLAEIVEPELTTIDQNSNELSRLAVNMLVDMIEGDDTAALEPKHVVLKPKLVIRKSA